MSYSTRFTLKVRYVSNGKTSNMRKAKARFWVTGNGRCQLAEEVRRVMSSMDETIAEHDGADIIASALEDYEEGYMGEHSWREHESDMIYLSENMPGMLFELTGFGKIDADIWRKFFLNGKVSGGQARIIFPVFGEYDNGT